MNSFFAVDPESINDDKDIIALFSKIGFPNGRFISQYPSNWIDFIIKKFSGRPILQAKIKRVIEINRDTLFESHFEYRRGSDWESNALIHLSNNAKVKYLISNSEKESIISLQKFLWSPDFTIPDDREDEVPANTASYLKVLEPLLSKSGSIYIADRYFQIRNQNGLIHRANQSFLRSLARAALLSKRCTKIILLMERSSIMTENQQFSQISSDLEYLSKDTNFNFGFFLFEKLEHPRYIFSMKAGIKFDHGILLNKPDATNLVSWISKSYLEKILHKYDI